MPLPERVVIDTSAFYALFSVSDEFHDRAVTSYERLLDRDLEFWTTSYALIETIALVHGRLGFETLLPLIRFIESNVHVFWVESSLHSSAMREFESSQGKGLSLVDWTVLLASRINSAHIFTFDREFGNQGATIIPRR